MREYIFILLCLICLGVLASHSSTEVYNRRVKRASATIASNVTQAVNNATKIVIADSKISNTNLTNKTEAEIKPKVDEHRATIQIRDTLNRIKKLKPAGLRIIRRVNKNETTKITGNNEATNNLKSLKGLRTVHHQLKRNIDKELHAEPARTSRIYFVSSEDFPGETGFDNFEGFYDLKNSHRRSHSLFGGGCSDKDKLLDLLTGESLIFNDAPRHIGESKLHHDPSKGMRYTKAYYVKGRPSNLKAKLKRSITSGYKLGGEEIATHHSKSHKDDKDFGLQHSNFVGYKQPPLNDFVKLTKMLIDLSEGLGEKPAHVQDSEVSLSSPGVDKFAEIIYKPTVMDSDDGGSTFAINDYFSNDLNSLAPQQHAPPSLSAAATAAAIVPMGYHEYSMPITSNMATSLKLQANAIDSTNKEDNDSDEYEMTCPVHFKRSIENGVKDGVVEVCSCHLYRKKKKLL